MKSKIKHTPRFAIVRKGYDVQSVEAYIESELKKAEAVQLEQRERILSLSSDLNLAAARLKGYEEREEQIKSAIVSATEKADNMTADLRFRYGMELDRLNNFRSKWTGVYSELKERYNFSKDALNMESVAISVKLELERFLAQDFSIAKGETLSDPEKQFRAEAERLSSTESGVAELKNKLLKADGQRRAPAAAFSLEEASRPTESLAELCEYLGLKSNVTSKA